MNPMQKTTYNLAAGSSGGLLSWLGWAVEHYNGVIGFIATTAGAVLVVVTAINAINIMRDRRQARREIAEERDRMHILKQDKPKN